MSDQDAAAFAAVYLVIGLVSLGFFLGITALLCWLLSGWLAVVPPEHRKQEPGKVWLLMIPLFNLYWVWQVFPPMALSFDSYFQSKSQPNESVLKMAKLYCWAVLAGFVGGMIPCLNMIIAPIAGLAGLVLLILLLVKFHAMKERIVGGGGAPPAPAAPKA